MRPRLLWQCQALHHSELIVGPHIHERGQGRVETMRGDAIEWHHVGIVDGKRRPCVAVAAVRRDKGVQNVIAACHLYQYHDTLL